MSTLLQPSLIHIVLGMVEMKEMITVPVAPVASDAK